ncbi:hypothetical protein SLS53_005868 [Cytospora paraplurivora]|uniref:Uncharacterized protein n=1 Tax=Cytospora paraplurivora TaxID=2898453 RepID=A0AAN9U7C1_9PEZI
MTAIDAQLAEEVKAIKALIQSFFDAINAADTKALQSHFAPSADLTIIRQDPPLPHGAPGSPGAGAATRAEEEEEEEKEKEERLTVVTRTTIEKFVKLLDDDKKRREGRPGPVPVLRETPDLDATAVRVDALFAAAWGPFEVTFDGVLHHYGTIVYTLGRVGAGARGEGWRVEGLTQSYRRTPGWPGGGEGPGAV